MENQALVQHIKQWLDLESKITEQSRQLRELRKQKKELSVGLMEVMKTNEIDCFDCNSGQLMYTKNIKKLAQEVIISQITIRLLAILNDQCLEGALNMKKLVQL